MANLYTCPRSSTRVAPAAPCSEWTLAYTGVPVLLLDGGNTKSRLKRQIQVGRKGDMTLQSFSVIVTLLGPDKIFTISKCHSNR